MAADAQQSVSRFQPAAFQEFRFLHRELDAQGHVSLGYALDDELLFVEEFDVPVARGHRNEPHEATVEALLALLHWVAGVSYYKAALPPEVSFQADPPPPAVAALLEALYSEGLGELAYTNQLHALPRPRFMGAAPGSSPVARLAKHSPGATKPTASQLHSLTADAEGMPARERPLGRVLVPVGGGKDSAVALEIVRRAGCELALFSVGDAPPIARTVAASGLPRLLVSRRLDPQLTALNAAGAINGHVPVTAIVSCVALLSAALNGFDAVAMANERSASAGNLSWDGVDINHQFSKGLRAELLLAAAVAELAPTLEIFSVLRPASELAVARAFARMERYHEAFTSCNALFRLDSARRASSWCCECPKCRFVFLALAPFSEPAHLREVFGRDLLDEDEQFEGFALLTATGGHKPFECVGEEQESIAAIRLLAGEERWSGHRVVARLVAEVLPRFDAATGDPERVLALSDEHAVPEALLVEVRALLGA